MLHWSTNLSHTLILLKLDKKAAYCGKGFKRTNTKQYSIFKTIDIKEEARTSIMIGYSTT
jgi:hypothetical protein